MEKEQEQFYKCPMCLEIAKDAVESECCNSIFCESCVKVIPNRVCPLCRKGHLRYKSNIVIRRIVNSLKTECSECNEMTTYGNLADHKKKCNKGMVTCKFFRCNQECKKSNFATHLFEVHLEELIHFYSTTNAYPIPSKIPQEVERYERKSEPINPIAILKNDKGNTARLGVSGVFYCLGKLEGNCCCIGICGPTNGCPCASCLKLTIKARNLETGYYVNREGATCKKVNGKIYCGRYFRKIALGHDGYCGPSVGPQCDACQILDGLLLTRYSKV